MKFAHVDVVAALAVIMAPPFPGVVLASAAAAESVGEGGDPPAGEAIAALRAARARVLRGGREQEGARDDRALQGDGGEGPVNVLDLNCATTFAHDFDSHPTTSLSTFVERRVSRFFARLARSRGSSQNT